MLATSDVSHGSEDTFDGFNVVDASGGRTGTGEDLVEVTRR
jgi:hypothetical protein